MVYDHCTFTVASWQCSIFAYFLQDCCMHRFANPRHGKGDNRPMSVQSIYEHAFASTSSSEFAQLSALCGLVNRCIMRIALVGICVIMLSLLVTGCGETQEVALATRAASTPRLPTTASTRIPTIATDQDAIRVARTIVSPYTATWQDVIATRENGVWRVIFRNYDPLPVGATPNDDYWRVPLSVFIDAATGVVLRQGYV